MVRFIIYAESEFVARRVIPKTVRPSLPWTRNFLPPALRCTAQTYQGFRKHDLQASYKQCIYYVDLLSQKSLQSGL